MYKINFDKVSVVGLGKLGLPILSCFASQGFCALGIDVVEEVVKSVNAGEAPFFEPDLQEKISKYKNNIEVTLDHARAIDETDATFIIVATPTDKEGNLSNIYVESTLRSLATHLKNNPKPYHLFVISSTVMPGSTHRRFIPIIEEHSGRKINQGFGVCYIPDFVALGSVISDFINPDLVVIGESNKLAGDYAVEIYNRLCRNKPHIARMSIISSEITKLSLNCYITMKISFANMLGNLCEKIKDANIDDITNAIGADKRISPYYFKSGPSFGGTCFPRDIKAFSSLSREYDHDDGLIKKVDRINKFQDKHLADIVLNQVHGLDDKSVSILGGAFKTNTPVIEESPAVKLIERLLKYDVAIKVFDRLAIDNLRIVFGDKVRYFDSAQDCVDDSSICVITTRDMKFKDLKYQKKKGKLKVIIDCWRILNQERITDEIEYIGLGKKQY